MAARPRIAPDPVPLALPVPGWLRGAPRDAPDDAGFFAGAALATLHPLAALQHPLASLWRQRLALRCAAAFARHSGRSEDEALLRDHWYLTREGDDPGPAGRLLKAWRDLGQPSALRHADWPARLAELFEPHADADLEAMLTGADLTGTGDPVAAAASVAATSLRLRPDCRALALWLADAVLARRLKWPAPVPLLAAQIARGELRYVTKEDGDGRWRGACERAYARAAIAAVDLYADLARRADRLIALAPQLRGKEADAVIARLMSEDAQPAKRGRWVSDRSSRRLFERLVALGAIRELTGRPSFRLYGL